MTDQVITSDPMQLRRTITPELDSNFRPPFRRHHTPGTIPEAIFVRTKEIQLLIRDYQWAVALDSRRISHHLHNDQLDELVVPSLSALVANRMLLQA